MFQFLFIEVLNRALEALLCIGNARVREEEAQAERAWAEHIPDAEASGAGPKLKEDVVETRDHVAELFF